MVRASRNRPETERRILAAVGETLSESGFRAFGINAVAKRAGVDKVLIYRYFGGLPELLAAYAEHGGFWYSFDDIAGPDLPPPEQNTAAAWLELAFRRHVAWLRARPVTLEILAWEMVEHNELTAALADVREKRGLAIMQRLAEQYDLPADLDLAALVALLAAATNYLLIRTRNTRQFQGIGLRDAKDWDRLFNFAGRIGDVLTRN